MIQGQCDITRMIGFPAMEDKVEKRFSKSLTQAGFLRFYQVCEFFGCQIKLNRKMFHRKLVC